MFSKVIALLRTLTFYLLYVPITIFLSVFFILSSFLFSKSFLFSFARAWCDFVINWLRLSCGVNYTVTGIENIPKSPCIVISNHQSSWETLLFYRIIQPVSPILKRELLHIPFFGWALSRVKPIAIDRSKPREASKSLLVQGKQRVLDGQSIIIFPEGHRASPQHVGKYSRSGAKLAIAAEVDILPVAHNAGDCWPKGQFIKTPGHIHVTIGTPIPTKDRDSTELSKQCEEWARKNAISAKDHKS